MNMLPNSLTVFPDTFDKMRQFNLELKYTSGEYTIYSLGDREFKSIQERLEAIGIPYIYTPDSLSQSMVIVNYYKYEGTIKSLTGFLPMTSMVNFNNKIDKVLEDVVTSEQSKLGSKYSIVELLSGE